MSDVDRLRSRLFAAMLSPLAIGVLGAGCQNRAQMPSCPAGDVCAAAAQAEDMRQTREQLLACPMYIGWGLDGGSDPPLPGLPPLGEGLFDKEATLKHREKGPTDMCCYHWRTSCPGGRPLVDDGRTVLPDVRHGAAASSDVSIGDLDDRTREALAAAWLLDARAEHASIASFARAAIELLAVGAPLELVAATQRASLNEVRHAERCFELASRYAGQTLTPGALPSVTPRPTDLAQLARDTFEEGCVAETLASLVAQRALCACEDEDVRAVLEEIADDEADHAALAWTTLAWAVRTGGAAAREAVQAAADSARRRMVGNGAPNREGGAPELEARHGRLSAAQRRTQHESWLGIVEPLLAEVLAA